MRFKHVTVYAAELEEKMECTELGRKKEEFTVDAREIERAVVAEIRHDVDYTGGNKRDDEGLYDEEPWVLASKRGVLHDHTHITEEYDGTNNHEENEICEEDSGGEAADCEFRGNLGGKCEPPEE